MRPVGQHDTAVANQMHCIDGNGADWGVSSLKGDGKHFSRLKLSEEPCVQLKRVKNNLKQS